MKKANKKLKSQSLISSFEDLRTSSWEQHKKSISASKTKKQFVKQVSEAKHASN